MITKKQYNEFAETIASMMLRGRVEYKTYRHHYRILNVKHTDNNSYKIYVQVLDEDLDDPFICLKHPESFIERNIKLPELYEALYVTMNLEQLKMNLRQFSNLK